MYLLTLLVAFMFTINLSSCEGRTCLDGYLEGTHVRGRLQNKFKNLDEPMYLLRINEILLEKDGLYRREYKVYVYGRDSSKRIKAVKIMTSGHPYCGEGQFTFNSTDFYQYKDPNCDSVFKTKNQNIPAQSPILIWSPPYCDCVQFRVIVVSGDVYYTDDENVESGPLSRKVCIHKQYNRLNYLTALCSVTDSLSAINVIGSQYFLRRHNLDAKMMNGAMMLKTLEIRLGQIRSCCIIMKIRYAKCLEDLRRLRIDNLCINNLTDIPMVNYKFYHTLDRQKQCCHLQGEQKYTCFSENGNITDIVNDTLLDFSNEDTDPANDLAIFGSFQDKQVLKHVTTVEFRRITSVTDKYIDPFIRGSNQINTEASKMTQDAKQKKKAENKQNNQCCKAGRNLKSSTSKRNRNTTIALIECEVGFKNFVSQNLISNFTACADKFATCCLPKQCCKAGRDYSARITSKEYTIVTDACKEGSTEYTKYQILKCHLELCLEKFASCCFEKTFKISPKNRLKPPV